MATFLLLPGAGGVAAYWDRVVPLLRGAGHATVAVDLPGEGPDADLEAYVALTLAAADGVTGDVVLVAQSMGGFTAFPVAERRPVSHLVLVNAMVPLPGETPDAWWDATGSEPARLAAARRHGYAETLDLETAFFHDVPTDVLDAFAGLERDEHEAAFASPCPFTGYPDVPVTVLAGAADRLFPAEFQDRVARDRLGVPAEVVPGGHLNALSEPAALTAALRSHACSPRS